MSQYPGKIFSPGCYQAATGIHQPRLIQYDLDYSDSLFFCLDTCSWVCGVWSAGHLRISGLEGYPFSFNGLAGPATEKLPNSQVEWSLVA